MVIRQNGQALARIADHVSDLSNRYKGLYENLYEELNRNLGDPGDESKIWYGPLAQGCRNAANKDKHYYDELKMLLDQLADTVRHQAEVWGTQQNSKY